MTQTPYLTDAEILAMAAPLVQPAAICRWLTREGFACKRRPNGMPLLSRAAFDSAFCSETPAANDPGGNQEPNAGALVQLFQKRGK